jgi:hypothetical protein
MAVVSTSKKTHTTLHKRTNQGGNRPKTSSMSKTQKNAFKKYRGQGR